MSCPTKRRFLHQRIDFADYALLSLSSMKSAVIIGKIWIWNFRAENMK
jgi:hypothetical protein